MLYAYHQETDQLFYPPTMVGVRYPDRARRFKEVSPDSIIYTMLRRDEPYLVEKILDDGLFQSRRFTQEEGIKSCLAVPLTAANRKVGVMFVNYRSEHHFTEDELADIKLFAHQAAVAIRNAQLHEETRRGQLPSKGSTRRGRPSPAPSRWKTYIRS
jgi:GAF domain-containing protein